MRPARLPLYCLLFIGLLLCSTESTAALYWNSGVRGNTVKVCFVGDAISAPNPSPGSGTPRYMEVLDYLKEFEYAANIKIDFLGECPAPVQQPNGHDYYDGDIRVVLPGTSVNATIPVLGDGCDAGNPAQFHNELNCVSPVLNRLECYTRGINNNNNRLWGKIGDNYTRHTGYQVSWRNWYDTETVDFEDIGPGFTGTIAVASRGANRLDLFAVGSDNALRYRRKDGSAWSSWENLGGDLLGTELTAATWGSNRLDVFAVGRDGTLQHRSWDGSAWSGWENLGGHLFYSGLSAVTWGTDRLDLFAVKADSTLQHRWWDGSVWSNWENLGGYIFGSGLSAVTWGTDRLDVFARGRDNALKHIWWDGSAWSSWESPGGAHLISGLSVTTWGPGRFDVFARGTDSSLWHKPFDGGNWAAWQSLGTNAAWGSWSAPPNALENGRSCLYNLKLGDDPWNATPYLNHTLHEFGHALGLAHEHVRDDVVSCATCRDFNPGSASDGHMTPYDRKSVMHYSSSCADSCGVIGNYGRTGLSDRDRLALHILYPEDGRTAEFIGTTVIKTNQTLKLQSAWKRRGANIGVVGKNFLWTIAGANIYGTDLQMALPAGDYPFTFTYKDLLDRGFHYLGIIRVLPPHIYDRTISAPIAAQLPLL